MENLESQRTKDLPQAPLKKEVLTAAELPPAPDNPPWNGLTALFVWIASVLLIFVVPSIALIIYIAAKGFDLTNPASLAQAVQGDPMAIFVNIVAVIPAHILTIALCWLVVTKGGKYSFREMMGWEWNGFKFWHVIAVLVGFFALAFVLTKIFGEHETDLQKILNSSRLAVYAVAFMATFTAPLVEEVVYRGVMYSAFQRTFNQTTAIILVTVLFAAVHVPQYYQSVATIILICLLSLVLTVIRAKTKNLLPCIALHTVFNGVQSILLVAEPFLREQVNQNADPAVSLFHLLK